MATNRLYHKTLPVKCLTHTARTNGTVTGDTVDKVQGTNAFNSVLFVILTATLTDGVHTISVQDSPDNSTWTDVAATGQTANVATVAATNNNSAFVIGYHGVQRYCRLKVVTTGTTTGGLLGAVAILGDPRNYPTQ